MIQAQGTQPQIRAQTEEEMLAITKLASESILSY